MTTPPATNYLGIDPSLSHTGVGIILKNTRIITESIIPPKDFSGVERLIYIKKELLNILESPHVNRTGLRACIEGPALGAINRADDIGQLRGILLLTLAEKQVPTKVVAPTALKKFATGRGTADKEDMIAAAREKWYLTLGHDEADALWLAEIAQQLHQTTTKIRAQLEVIHGISNPKKKGKMTAPPKGNI